MSENMKQKWCMMYRADLDLCLESSLLYVWTDCA